MTETGAVLDVGRLVVGLNVKALAEEASPEAARSRWIVQVQRMVLAVDTEEVTSLLFFR